MFILFQVNICLMVLWLMVITCRVSNQLKHVCKGAYGASSALLMFCGNDSWITAGITDAGFGLRL